MQYHLEILKTEKKFRQAKVYERKWYTEEPWKRASQLILLIRFFFTYLAGSAANLVGWRLASSSHSAIMYHCFFAEPTHSPCMLLGMSTSLNDQISVQDIGIDNKTAADDLAVNCASGFVGQAMEQLIDGCYTLNDQTMYDLLSLLDEEEDIQLEPSALAGMIGPQRTTENHIYQAQHQITPEKMQQCTHLVWATGGGMVPAAEMQRYLAQGMR